MSGEVLVGIAGILAGFLGGVWASGYNADRERIISQRGAATALLAELARVRRYIGVKGGGSMLSSIYGARVEPPRLHRWVEAIPVALAGVDAKLLPLFMQLELELYNIGDHASNWFRARELKEKAEEVAADLAEQRASGMEPSAHVQVPGLLRAGDELGDREDSDSFLSELLREIQSESEAERAVEAWQDRMDEYRGFLKNSDDRVRDLLREIEQRLAESKAARYPLGFLSFHPTRSWRFNHGHLSLVPCPTPAAVFDRGPNELLHPTARPAY